jgi:hypothetical protein
MCRTRHLLTSVSAVLGLAATALAVPLQPVSASGSAAPGWGPVVDLSRAPADVFDLELAAAADGTALAAWVRWRGRDARLMAAPRRPDGTWWRPRAVPGGRNAAEVELAFDGRGRAVVAWTKGRAVKATRRSPSGSWSKPVVLHRTPAGRRGSLPRDLELAVNDRGRAVVAWETVDDDRDEAYTRPRVQAVVGTAADTWSRPRTLSRRGLTSTSPEVALDRAGRATVVWADVRRGGSRVAAASREIGAPWQGPQVLSGRRKQTGVPQLTSLASGELAVAYGVRGSRTSGIRVRRWAHDTGWTRTQTSPCPARQWCGQAWTDAAMDGESKVSVAWAGRGGAVWVDDLSAAGERTRSRLARPRSVFYGMNIAVNPSGDAVVGWVSVDGGHHPVQGAYRPRGGSWEPPRNLSARRGDSWGPALVVENDGTATAVWSHGTNAEFSSIVRARNHPRGLPAAIATRAAQR